MSPTFKSRQEKIKYLQGLANGNRSVDEILEPIRLLSYEFLNNDTVYHCGTGVTLTRAEALQLEKTKTRKVSWVRYTLQSGNEPIIDIDNN